MADPHKRYWMHRINGGENGWVLSYPLLRDHNIISIGWSFLSSQEIAVDIQGRGIDAITEAYENEGATWSKNAYFLNNFVHLMHEGDIVMVPDDRYVSFYKISDEVIITNENLSKEYLDEIGIKRQDYELKTSGERYIDLGFYRRVEPLVLNVPRGDLDEKLYKKTRVPQTNLNIDGVDYLVEQILTKGVGVQNTIIPIDYAQLVDSIKQNLENIPEGLSFQERLEKAFARMHRLVRYGVRFEYTQNKHKQNVDVWYSEVENSITKNIDAVNSVVSAYLQGDLFNSIEYLNDWWSKNSEDEFPQSSIEINDILYRIRLKGEKAYKEKDLFHIPFDKRGMVTTQRFSIPGYPCLYLGKSIYVCWEEMKRPALSNFATSALRAQEDINLLDLRLRKQMQSREECVTFMKMLPVIIACSLSVANDHDNFKPEYILPQLFLHIIVVQNQNRDSVEDAKEGIKVDGIRYTSTVVNKDFDFINADSTYELADCFVLPVRIPLDSKRKYCPVLSRKFQITKPRYYENEYIKDSLAFLKEHISNITIKNGKLIEPHRQNDYNYRNSYFSYIEQILKSSEFKSISEKS